MSLLLICNNKTFVIRSIVCNYKDQSSVKFLETLLHAVKKKL